jgi:mannosyltransferase OCH1-like enzyme
MSIDVDQSEVVDKIVHFLWIYGKLSKMECLCINSFLMNGYVPILWTYGDMKNIHNGAIVKDAREIIPEERIFTYKNGSYAGFSNFFRYKVLTVKGGMWADTDVVCLESIFKRPDHPFLVAERIHDSNKIMINNNIIYSPDPSRGDIIDLALAITERFPLDKLEWGDCGPKLLTNLYGAYPKIGYTIMGPEFANPVDFWNCPKHLITPGFALPENATFLHLYNEMWRRNGIDKDGVFDKKSLIGLLIEKYL